MKKVTSQKLLVFDSHPVQYRVPIWRAMEKRRSGSVHVAYASDCSVRGHLDRDFGRNIAWDDPMLEGYDHTVLNCENGKPMSGWGSLTGEGVSRMVSKIKPAAIMLTGLGHRYDHTAYLQARMSGIPLWYRCDTNEQAVLRGILRSVLRSAVYRVVYLGLARMFYVGELNRQHCIKYGISADRLRPALHCTVDRYSGMSPAKKQEIRDRARLSAKISAEEFVVGFAGKFTPKKNPALLFGMLESLPEEVRRKCVIYLVGSGELEPVLRQLAQHAVDRFGVRTWFAGFANQSEIGAHYLAMDVMALPSRRMGETWGLVVNEALQAGCGVAASDAVGCTADFASWERFRVFPEGDSPALAAAVEALALFPRAFNWAEEHLKNYSIEAAAQSFINELDALHDPSK